MIYHFLHIFLSFILFSSFAFLHGQTTQKVLDEIDSSLILYDSYTAYNLINEQKENTVDSVNLLNLKIREVQVLEQLELYDEAIAIINTLIAQKEMNVEQEARIYLFRALIYEILNNFSKARQSLDKVEEIIEDDLRHTSPNSKIIGISYIRESSYYRTYANAHKDNESLNKYIHFANKAVEFSSENGYNHLRAEANMLLSFDNKLSNKEKEAYVKEALNWWKKSGDVHAVSAMYNSLAIMHIQNPSLAMKYNDSAITVLKGSYLPSMQCYAYETRYEIFVNAGNTDSALHYYKLFQRLQDNIDINHRKISIERMDHKAHLEEKKFKNHILQEAIVQEKRNSLILLIIAIALIIFSIIFLYLYIKLVRSKRELSKSKQTISNSLREKTILLAELNHRVKNDLSLILSLVQLQRSKGKRKDSDWDNLEQRINTMAMAHSLYTYSGKNLSGSPINLQIYLTRISSSYHDMKVREIQFYINVASIHVSVENALPIGIIFNELVSNSVKHAIVPNELLVIQFDVELVDNVFKLMYKDNGVKFGEASQESIGIFILKALTEQLNGSIQRTNSQYDITLYKKTKL